MRRVERADIDVLVLCGGLGKRLRSVVNDRPKPMAEVGGRPFLDILVEHVASFGFRRFILCTGYMADCVKRHYRRKEGSLDIICSEEKTPLGTGGAIKNAYGFINSSPFLVVNGDSLCDVDLEKFLEFHLKTKALCSIVITNAQDTNDCGNVALGRHYQVADFSEKTKGIEDSYVSVGVYLFEKRLLSLMPAGHFSLEEDIFPVIVNREFYGYISDKGFIDIGTAQSYKKAAEMLGT